VGEVHVPEEVVGRGDELAATERLIERAATGLAALVLTGAAGIGKTTIWEAGVAAARAASFTVLRTRPARSETVLTLGGLTDLLGPIADRVVGELPEPQRHALEVALLRVAPSGILPDQRALSVAVTGAMRELTAEAPVLIAIDDVQWIDESSAALLAYALRRLADRPIGVLATARAGEIGGENPREASELLAAVATDRRERVDLEPLPLGALHGLFQLRLGRSFPRLALVRIEAASGGNPLYALEIGRALKGSTIPTDPHVPLPIPDTLGSLMTGRIAVLPVETREALQLVAAAAEPTLEVVETARPGSRAALASAIEAGVVLLDGDTIRFAHPLLAQSALNLVGPPELRRIHADLAVATPSPDARARHLGQAADRPDASVAAALADAAGSARDRGATLDAVALFLDAARATPSDRPILQLERSRLAAECLFIDLSETIEADAILEAAVGRAPAGPERADALSLRALLRYYNGRVHDAVELGEAALVEAGQAPLVRATVLGRLAFLVMQLDLERGLTLVDEAIDLIDGHPGGVDPDLHANALLLRANGELGLVRPTRPEAIERGLRLITPGGRSWEHEGADGSAFGLARHTDDLDRAIAMTRELIRAKSGAGGDDPFNLVQLSGLLVFRGAWDEARGVAAAAMDGYARERSEIHTAWGLRGVALVAVHEGRLDDARTFAGEGLRIATERGDAVVAAFHRHILGFAALSEADWVEADGQLTEAATLAEAVSIRHPGRLKIAGDRVEAALALGDTGRAAAIVATLEEAVRIAPTPWVCAVGARSLGLLAAARGETDVAASELDRAMIEHDRLPMPFERARTLLAKGRLHRRRKEKRLADEALHEALAVFDGLGARIWTQTARTELARVGRRPRAPGSLTETERQVALLAAQGLTSRQIAEQAFLAPKTVGNVLGRVYAKLGIHSRAELGSWMASVSERPPDHPSDLDRVGHRSG
jgi:DNA-binding CsgD family transcriptional regulator